jgi:hypothetical protein
MGRALHQDGFMRNADALPAPFVEPVPLAVHLEQKLPGRDRVPHGNVDSPKCAIYAGTDRNFHLHRLEQYHALVTLDSLGWGSENGRDTSRDR